MAEYKRPKKRSPAKQREASGKARQETEAEADSQAPVETFSARLTDSLFRPGIGSCAPAPWRLLAPLLVLAWIARAAVALTGDFILHPDEIYQYLEPAHGVVYGSAVITWEMGTGARGFLIPGLIAGVLYVLKFFGIDTPDGYIPAVKLFLATVSLSLPLAMYFATRSLWSERAGLIAFVLGCFWYEFVGFAHKPLSDMLSCYAAITTIALACVRRRTLKTVVLAGLAAALTIGLRWQVGIMLVPFSLLLLLDLNVRERICYVGAGLAGMAVFGLLDHLTWGGFFHSIRLNIMTNLEANKFLVVEQQASDIHYLYWAAWSSLGMYWIAVGAGLARFRRYSLALGLILIFFAVHVQLLHKEYRFAFPWIPLWLMIASDLLERLARRCREWKVPAFMPLAAAGMLAAAVSVAGILNALPYQDELYLGYSQEHNHVSFLEPDPHLTLYRKLSKDNDVEGILEQSRPLSSGGGFYYLHRKVAILPPQVLSLIRDRLEVLPDLQEWFTHIILDPEIEPPPGYALIERTSDFVLYEVRPDLRAEVFPLHDHLYSVDLPQMMLFFPHLRQYLPKGEDFRIDFVDPE